MMHSFSYTSSNEEATRMVECTVRSVENAQCESLLFTNDILSCPRDIFHLVRLQSDQIILSAACACFSSFKKLVI